MRLKLHSAPLTFVFLILYVFVPMLDSMVCADCLGNAPFRGGTTIGHLQTPHDDVVCPEHDGTKSKTADEKDTKSLCSICANVLMGVEVFSPHVHTSVAPWHSPWAVTALSEPHYSINKPPQNLLV